MAYFRIRPKIHETREILSGRINADVDAGGRLVGVELLGYGEAEVERFCRVFLPRLDAGEEDWPAVLAEFSAPSKEKLTALRRKFGPPTAWYEQEGEPLEG